MSLSDLAHSMAQARHGDAPATSLTFSASARVLYSEVEDSAGLFRNEFFVLA